MSQLTNRELLTGKVTKELYAFGSKSERDAHFLVTKKDKFLLRRAGENAMSDPGLDQFVGKKIAAYGYRHLGSFVMDSYSIVKTKGKFDKGMERCFTEENSVVEFSKEIENGTTVYKATVYKVKPRSLVGTVESMPPPRREQLTVYVGDNWDTVFGKLTGDTL